MSTPLLLAALAPAPLAMGWALRLRAVLARGAAREAELGGRIAELEEECAALQRTASVDAVTGVWNYRHLQLTLDRELERSRRSESAGDGPRPLAVLLLEVGGFDKIVAAHGRARANAILRDLAQRLGVEIRRCDTLGRYGGEEFLVLLPDTGVEGAIQVAERLCWSVRRHQLLDWSPAGPPPPRPVSGNGLTAAIGIAVLPRDGSHGAVLLRAADQALAQARRDGGDCWRGAPLPTARSAGPTSIDRPRERQEVDDLDHSDDPQQNVAEVPQNPGTLSACTREAPVASGATSTPLPD